MSIAYQCDRCGKLVAIEEATQKIDMIIVNFRDVYGNENRHYEDMTRLDICEECSDSLTEWLEEKKGENNGRNVCTGPAEKGAGNKRRKTRKADSGDPPSEG